ELCRVVLGKSARSAGFAYRRIQWPTIDVARNAPRRGGALLDSTASAAGENNHRGAGSVINCERKKKLPFVVDLFFHQHGFDRKLSDFHRQHSRCMLADIIWFLGESHAANPGAPGSPRLDLNDHFAAKFFGDCKSFISG